MHRSTEFSNVPWSAARQKAARQWTFRGGTLAGSAVSYLACPAVTWAMTEYDPE
jgi:hypothetical protein